MDIDLQILDDLSSICGIDAILCNEPMSSHTTFEIGGPADFFVEPSTEDEIKELINYCINTNKKYRILGLGSDLLISDNGLRGIVIHLGNRFSNIEIDRCSCTLTAQAGASNEKVSDAACAAGLSGYEFASGIPGSIGGAAIMNAGAYDGELKDVAVYVRCIDEKGQFAIVKNKLADWSYRHSMMSDKGYVILNVTLSLTPDEPALIRERIDELTAKRESKQPLDMPSAGSTFKRPKGYFAGPLIQEAGMQGAKVGGAQVSEKHAGFVVNAGGASSSDVWGLIKKVQDEVQKKSGVKLEPEVRFWED